MDGSFFPDRLSNVDDIEFRRLLIALATKPFAILSGGSGTGKTQIALAVSSYLAASRGRQLPLTLRVGDKVGEGRAEYTVKRISPDSVTIQNPGGSLIDFPEPVINDWVDAIKSGRINKAMGGREQRDIVKVGSRYDSYYHGWTAQLMGLGYAIAEKGEAQEHESSREATNSAIIPVGADWTDNRNVLGYVNHLRPDGNPVFQSTPVLDLLLEASKVENEALPFFLILDEMNLSHVERYFADFLSVMEQKDGAFHLHSEGPREEAGFTLPRFEGDDTGVPRTLAYPANLFVIGTVNVDETTYMFSSKVLDRANVIEFSVESDEIDAFLKEPGEYSFPERAADGVAEAFQALALQARSGELEDLPVAVADASRADLVALFEILKKGRFEFAYRTANEVNRYLRVCYHLAEDKEAWRAGDWRSDLDDQIVQKILPKLHGSVGRVGTLLGALAVYCGGKSREEALAWFPEGGGNAPPLRNALAQSGDEGGFPKSRAKLVEMIRVLLDEQFVSFIN